MDGAVILEGSVNDRARAWRNATHATVCDVIEPWAAGTVVRASRYPAYYDFNVLRVERKTDLDMAALGAQADAALAGLGHRRVDFDLAGEAESRRAAFEQAGWKTTRLLWMRHEDPPPKAAGGPVVVEVDYGATADLRLRWHLEDFPEYEYEDYLAGAREIALVKGARTLAVLEREEPLAFAQVQWGGDAAEITSVYVHPEHRGRGLGTAVTVAAIEAAQGTRDLWIVADEEDRAKDLYARLGFRVAWRTVEFLCLR